MRDSMTIGPTPVEESCAQVGADNYSTQARKECRAFINQLRRQFGPEPAGAQLKIVSSPHDFGPYLEVHVVFDTDNEAAEEYAYKLEAETPATWDAEAREELRPKDIWEMSGRQNPFTIGAVLRHKHREE